VAAVMLVEVAVIVSYYSLINLRK